jgi:hypothetical protein
LQLIVRKRRFQLHCASRLINFVVHDGERAFVEHIRVSAIQCRDMQPAVRAALAQNFL